MVSKAIATGRSRWKWLALAGLSLAVAFLPLPPGRPAPTERYFRLEARRFAYAPAVLDVNPGDRVTIDLAALDVVHGLAVDGYDLNITADPGQTARLTFVADRAGTFRFRCTMTCGALHPFMLGKLNVGPNMLWWRAAALMMLAALAGLIGWRRPWPATT